MKTTCLFLLAATVATLSAASSEVADDLVLVEGGTFKNTQSNYYEKDVTIADFYLGKHEVTQKEWNAVMPENPSHFKGDDLPVEMVTWYDCIEYCNQRSLKEGLEPYYTIEKEDEDPNNKNPRDTIRWTVTANPDANGYRLPTEAEWEYAAGGGQESKSYTYSGSDEIDEVAWYWRNSGDEPLKGAWNWPLLENNNNRTQAVGGKEPNELGLYDMSGNVREWCWDWHGELTGEGDEVAADGSASGDTRVWKGGGWVGGDFACETSFRGNYEPHSMGYDQGFRVSRNR